MITNVLNMFWSAEGVLNFNRIAIIVNIEVDVQKLKICILNGMKRIKRWKETIMYSEISMKTNNIG